MPILLKIIQGDRSLDQWNGLLFTPTNQMFCYFLRPIKSPVGYYSYRYIRKRRLIHLKTPRVSSEQHSEHFHQLLRPIFSCWKNGQCGGQRWNTEKEYIRDEWLLKTWKRNLTLQDWKYSPCWNTSSAVFTTESGRLARQHDKRYSVGEANSRKQSMKYDAKGNLQVLETIFGRKRHLLKNCGGTCCEMDLLTAVTLEHLTVEKSRAKTP